MSTVPQHIGKYELQQQLGRGSAGEVWKAHNPLVHQDVAIKLLYPDLQSDPNFMTHFAQQGHLLTSLHYPNLVRVREVNISRPPQANETTAYIVMDYVDGQTLADYIKVTSHQGVFPSPEQIVYLFTSLGIAIDYGHQRGFVHGNIKPGNILLARLNTILALHSCWEMQLASVLHSICRQNRPRGIPSPAVAIFILLALCFTKSVQGYNRSMMRVRSR